MVIRPLPRKLRRQLGPSDFGNGRLMRAAAMDSICCRSDGGVRKCRTLTPATVTYLCFSGSRGPRGRIDARGLRKTHEGSREPVHAADGRDGSVRRCGGVDQGLARISDEVLRDLCEDYRLARETLTRLKKAKPKRSAEISEYTILVSELEDEIIRRLLGAEERPTAEQGVAAMSNAIHPGAPHHLPPFITAPGETDYFYNGSAIFIVIMIVVLGSLYFRLHALPEHLAHDNSNKVQFQLVGVLALLALFTHNNIFWVAALLLALVRDPGSRHAAGRDGGVSCENGWREVRDRTRRRVEAAAGR